MPILYPGNKLRYISGILKDMVKPASRVVDPFAGSAVIPTQMFKAGMVKKAVIGDTSPEMINIFKQLKYNEDQTIANMQRIMGPLSGGGPKATVGQADIISLKSLSNQKAAGMLDESEQAAADMVIGNYTSRYNPSIPTDALYSSRTHAIAKESIVNRARDTAMMLKKADIIEGDFKQTLGQVAKNDFVVLDPPYIGTRGYSKEFKNKLSFDAKEMADLVKEVMGETSGIMYNTAEIRPYFPKVKFKETGKLPNVMEVEGRWGNVWDEMSK